MIMKWIIKTLALALVTFPTASNLSVIYLTSSG